MRIKKELKVQISKEEKEMLMSPGNRIELLQDEQYVMTVSSLRDKHVIGKAEYTADVTSRKKDFFDAMKVVQPGAVGGSSGVHNPAFDSDIGENDRLNSLSAIATAPSTRLRSSQISRPTPMIHSPKHP